MVTKIRSARVKGGFMKSKMEREANKFLYSLQQKLVKIKPKM